MLRALFGLVSLLAVVAIAAVYFTSSQPEVTQGQGTYSKIEDQANAAAAKMAHDPQVQVDAATAAANGTASATNAPAAGN